MLEMRKEITVHKTALPDNFEGKIAARFLKKCAGGYKQKKAGKNIRNECGQQNQYSDILNST